MNPQSNEPILNYISQGSGPAVILIHGMMTSHHDWETLIPELVARGFHTLAVDLFGHGDSPKPDMHKLYNFKVVFGTLVEWIDSLDIEKPFFLVGHSMGGYLSLMYTLRHPQNVRALSLLDPLYSLKQLPPFMINTHRLSVIGAEMLKVAPQKMVQIALGWGPTMENDFTPRIRERVVEDVMRASPYVLNIASTLPDLKNELGKITKPVQVVWGDKDGLLNPASFPTMVAAMPHAIGHVLSGRGHQPHLGNPDQVNQLILEFLERNMLPHEKVAAPEVEEAIAITPAEMKARLMAKAEALVDDLLRWGEQTEGPTPEQVEERVILARRLWGAEISTVLQDGVNQE